MNKLEINLAIKQMLEETLRNTGADYKVFDMGDHIKVGQKKEDGTWSEINILVKEVK